MKQPIGPIMLKFGAISLVLTQASLERAFSQTLPIRPSKEAAQCDNLDGPIYLAAQRITIQGKLRACSDGIYDATSGAYASKPGERLMIVSCRYAARSAKFLVRARMNTAYLLNPSDDADMSMTAYVGKSGLRLENSGSALPFVPGRILNLDRQKGYPIFGYTDLRFLPSRINQAYPLNSRSIVVSIDGCGVSSENALGAMLHSPPAKDYVEVIYYQEGETSGAFYRAFVPMYSRPTVEVEWTKLVRENPAVVPDRYGRLLSYAAAFTFVALVAYFKTSPLGRRLAQEQQECIRQHSDEAIEITC